MTKRGIALSTIAVLSLCLLLALAVVGLRSHRLYAVQTGSMSPAIPSRSMVLVELGVYELGQPITFNHDGSPITHRYVGKNIDGTLVTKGDANDTPDATGVKPADVVGGVVAAPANWGYWLVYIKSPIGFSSLIVTILLLYQIWMLFGTKEHELAVSAGQARHAFL